MNLQSLTLLELYNLKHQVEEELWNRDGLREMNEQEFSLPRPQAIQLYCSRTGARSAQGDKAYKRFFYQSLVS